MREAPGQYLHTIFCSELSGEHQVQGEESDEISPRVIISCKRSFIIEWQLRYCIRVARGRWEFENWDWLKSGHQPPSLHRTQTQKLTKRYLGFHQPFNLLKQNSLRIGRSWEPISQNTLHWYHLHKTSIASAAQANSTTQPRSSWKLLMF